MKTKNILTITAAEGLIGSQNFPCFKLKYYQSFLLRQPAIPG